MVQLRAVLMGHPRLSSALKMCVAMVALMLAATTYVSVVTGVGADVGAPHTDERAAAVLHWRYRVNQDVAACAAPTLRAELGDGPFEPGAPPRRLSVPPSDRFSQIIFDCGDPGGIGDKVWTLLIGSGTLVFVVMVFSAVRSQPRIRRPDHPANDVRGHRYGRPGPKGIEPGVIRGPLSGWR